MKTFLLITLLALVAFSMIHSTDACFEQDNAKKAAALNKKFSKVKVTDKCTLSEFGCIGKKFAICGNSGWVTFDCPVTTQCSFLPLVNKPDTPNDIALRFSLAKQCRGKTG
ncbi:8851_t:CDS:2 [Paraglomus brasilianum]|uniref:8851_t:CDS:1 n=1 Tax=Paraglomus brasilianum TaxID=144538 RepID=A0A9N9GN46_9GLOM|nr:8851_t:CDS:2 [Paraglomus brasilianum]